VYLALDILAILQMEEGTHDLAGDEAAELLILQQLGTLGALDWFPLQPAEQERT